MNEAAHAALLSAGPAEAAPRPDRRQARAPRQGRCPSVRRCAPAAGCAMPAQAPAMPAAMAPIVSVSPPRLALMTAACQGSPSATSSTAKAAGTDSWLATPVPTRSTIRPIASACRLAAHQLACPFDPRRDIGADNPVVLLRTKRARHLRAPAASRQSPPATPWLTAAATAAAAAMAIEVLWVARQVSATLATSASSGSGWHHDADRRDPHCRAVGIAARGPASSGGTPALMASMARLVDGPSRS